MRSLWALSLLHCIYTMRLFLWLFPIFILFFSDLIMRFLVWTFVFYGSIFMLFINSESFQQVFLHIYIRTYIYFPLNPFLPPKHKTTRVRMLDAVTWITETFQFFKSFSSLCFILYCFYYYIFKFTDLYLLQCLMSDGWQNLAEKCSFQTCSHLKKLHLVDFYVAVYCYFIMSTISFV